MEEKKEQYGLKWLTPGFFVTGWPKFFELEKNILPIWLLIILSFGVLQDESTRETVAWMALVVIMRRVIVGGLCLSTKRLDGQTVLITGANTGIGRETALDLSARGAKIIMGCRDTKKAEKVAQEIKNQTGGDVDVFSLDLSSLNSVREFAKEVKSRHSRIHMLINNAGIMATPKSTTEDGHDITMCTNHLGPFLLTCLLLPLLHHSEPGRIISIASMEHWRGKIHLDNFNFSKGPYNRMNVYASSKLANMLFARQLAQELKGTNIQAFSVHPGATQSELARSLPIPLSTIWAKGSHLFIKSTTEGAQTTIYCATEASQDPLIHFADCTVGNPSPQARDDALALKVWELSETLVGLSK
ncbi:unnamed protein product [Meganyctiphanes norvegica]|uniref:Uncharacterized protein n=1 Tax=Meganyctiphanes norvegica TaxID=48144 RepID=A0AAV2R5B2_MEGNR